MKIQQCPRENEVVETVSAGCWPDSCGKELPAHVASCLVCQDVVAVATAMQADFAAVSKDIKVPSSGLVWWRSELRARREAMRKAERPLTLAHAFAGACAVGVLAALLNTSWFINVLPGLLQQHLMLSLTLGALIIIAPVALYFVLSDK